MSITDYQQILQTVASAIVCLDQAQQIVFFNRSAEQLFGYTAVEMLERPFLLLLPTEFAQQQFQALMDKSRETRGEPLFHAEEIIWAQHKNNNTFPIELNLSQSRQANGRLVTTILIRDITHRLEVESTYRQQNQELTLLNNASRHLTAILDIDEVLIRVLDEVRRILDVEACSVWLVDAATGELVCEQMTDPHALQVIGWRLPAGVGNAGWVITHGQSLIVPDAWVDERHYRGIEEETRHYIRSILTVPLGEAPDTIGVIQVVDTFPDRFRESDLLLMESLSAIAKIAIENARLYAALKETQERLVQQERFAALGQMSATVAHELRNPLTAIRMGVDYLLQGVDSQDSRWRGAALMKTNMDRIDRLVEDILFVGRIHQSALAPGWLRPLIIAEIERWQLTLAHQQLHLQVDLADNNNLKPVMLNKEQMTRALTNLIANSVDVLPPGGKINLTFYQEDAAQIIRIADNGPGIAPPLLNKIFEPFFTTKARGTGLGLSIVKRIVEEHHGTIGVESGQHEGTTFTIRLPIGP